MQTLLPLMWLRCVARAACTPARGLAALSCVAAAFCGCSVDEVVHPVDAGGSGGHGECLTIRPVETGAGAGGQELDFVLGATLPAPTGAGNYSVIADDLDGDGVRDLVVANPIGGFVSVLRGVGDGTFHEVHRSTEVSSGDAAGLATGDFNSDGVRDVVASAWFKGISVMLGRGDGTLEPPVAYGSENHRPNGIAVADLNNDGHEDMLIGQSTLSGVLMGRGDGTFDPMRNQPYFIESYKIAVGDLDGDGAIDVVVVNNEYDAKVAVLKGAGNGSLHLVQTLMAGAAEDVALGFLDGDDRLDLVLGAADSEPNVRVALNRGDGTFGEVSRYEGGILPAQVEVADLDADGWPDLVAADRLGSEVAVLLNDGSGAFRDAALFPAGHFPRGLAIADVNGDGRPDLAVGNGGPGLSVLAGNGDGTFDAWACMVFGAGARGVTVTSLDGDGEVDIALGNFGGTSISVLRGKGGGRFDPGDVFPLAGEPGKLAIGDFNGDAIVDIATIDGWASASESALELLTGTGAGAFSQTTLVESGPLEKDFAAADLNGDGLTDFVVATGDAANAHVDLANGDGTFSYDSLPWIVDAVAIDDFDGDMTPDIVAAVDFSTVVMRGNGDGTFQDAAQTLPMDDLSSEIVTGDFNNDGNTDFATTATQEDFLMLKFGAGDGVTFTSQTFHLSALDSHSLVAGDLDGDGWLDLAIVIQDKVAILWNNAGSFEGGPLLTAGSRPSSIGLSDVNGDQRLDMVVTGMASNDVSILLNNMP